MKDAQFWEFDDPSQRDKVMNFLYKIIEEDDEITIEEQEDGRLLVLGTPDQLDGMKETLKKVGLPLTHR